MTQPNIALIIVFNHRFDQNIPTLEKLYDGRFSNIHFLVPFYDGNQSNVIPVYANSYHYSSYIAQGVSSFFKQEYTHYFFVADDMILNPAVNEHSILQLLNVAGDDCFIPEVKSMHEIFDWWHVESAMKFRSKDWGIEATNELPTYQEAVDLFALHHLQIKPLLKAQVFTPEPLLKRAKRLVKEVSGRAAARNDFYELPYPQVCGLSDILLVSKQAMQKFARYCGVFGALNLFVELAIPTSLVLAAKSIKYEKGLELQGRYLWTDEELSILKKYNQDLNKLVSDFPEGYLFIHPVKISKWKC